MTNPEGLTTGYVLTSDGLILVQVVDLNSKWGYYLADDDQTWDGGFGVASSWEELNDDDPRITAEIRERLEYLLEEQNA